MTINQRARFCDNNFISSLSIEDYSSQLTANPFSNSYNNKRSLVWSTAGNFDITTANNKIYINDGADKTVTLTVGSYTYTTLAAHVETQLNASSSNWSCDYDTTGSTFKFTISNTGSVTLRLSQAANAAWDTLGYTTSLDLVGTSFVATEQRNHTSEYAIYDFGYQAQVKFAAIVSTLGQPFSISQSGTIKLQANNLNVWTAPQLDITLTVTDEGIYHFIETDDTGYRYWRILIEDKLNALGPEGIEIGYIYLGDYVTLTDRNVSAGLEFNLIDPSDRLESEEGTLYFKERIKYHVFKSMGIKYVDQTSRELLQSMYRKLGNTTPFFISVDPTGCLSTVHNMTKMVVFDGQPNFKHVFGDKWIWSFELREVQ